MIHTTPTVYAIDFGTSNSLLAAAHRTRVYPPVPLDPEAPDPTVLRSILFFPDRRRCFFGSAAIAEFMATGMQGRLIRSIKKHLPSRAFIGTLIDGRPMNLEHLIGVLLGEMRRRANRFFDADVTRVVLGRPALFSSVPEDDRFAQYRLERAARIAGFTDVGFCPEPVAAARSFHERLDRERLLVVADLGGGTSDFSVIRMRPGHWDPSDVLAIGGLRIAGDALDGALMRHEVARHFGSEIRYRVPTGSNVMTMPRMLRETLCSPADLSLLQERDVMAFLRDRQRWSLDADDRRRMEQLFTLIEDALGFSLFEAIERAKRELSDATETVVRFAYPTIDISQRVSRQTFEADSAAETAAILATLDRTLNSAGVSPAQVDIVCCTGGTARVPAIARALEARFGVDRIERMATFHSVIAGLAEHARARDA